MREMENHAVAAGGFAAARQRRAWPEIRSLDGRRRRNRGRGLFAGGLGQGLPSRLQPTHRRDNLAACFPYVVCRSHLRARATRPF